MGYVLCGAWLLVGMVFTQMVLEPSTANVLTVLLLPTTVVLVLMVRHWSRDLRGYASVKLLERPRGLVRVTYTNPTYALKVTQVIERRLRLAADNQPHVEREAALQG